MTRSTDVEQSGSTSLAARGMLGFARMPMRRLIEEFRALIGGLVPLLIGDSISKVFGFIASILMARRLGSSDFGAVMIAYSVANYLTLPTFLGLPQMGAREIAKRRSQWASYFLNITALRLAVTITILACFWAVLRPFVGAEQRRVFFAAALWMLPLAINTEWVFQGLQEFKVVGLIRLLSRLGLVLFVYIWVRPGSLTVAALSRAGGEFLGVVPLCLLLVLRIRKDPVTPSVHMRLWPSLLRGGAPLFLSFLFSSTYSGNLDRLFLAAWYAPRFVGYYSVAYDLHQVAVNVIQLVALMFYPKLSHAWSLGHDDFSAVRRTFLRVSVGLAIPIFVGGVIVSAATITRFYGPGYAPAAVPFCILMLNPIIIAISASFAVSLMAADKGADVVKVYAIGAVMNVVLNYVLIRPWGMNGAAIATLSSEASVLLAGMCLFRRVWLRREHSVEARAEG